MSMSPAGATVRSGRRVTGLGGSPASRRHRRQSDHPGFRSRVAVGRLPVAPSPCPGSGTSDPTSSSWPSTDRPSGPSTPRARAVPGTEAARLHLHGATISTPSRCGRRTAAGWPSPRTAITAGDGRQVRSSSSRPTDRSCATSPPTRSAAIPRRRLRWTASWAGRPNWRRLVSGRRRPGGGRSRGPSPGRRRVRRSRPRRRTAGSIA